jgi:hypothetical protein
VRELRVRVTTRNDKRAPEFMAIHMEGGSFRHFYGEWALRPLGDIGCHISFQLQYELALRAEALAGRLIEHAADRMVDAFVLRADAVYAAPDDPSLPKGQPEAGSCVRLLRRSKRTRPGNELLGLTYAAARWLLRRGWR